ncbi:hypothetical protein D3Z36_14595 [Lachnospiraceae bacterium]|nr:hypothetical protein [Lachnospiraceae bacterium]
MQKVIEALKEQLGKTAKNIVENKLSASNLDEIFKLTVSIKNLEYMEKGEWEPVVEAADSVIKKYSNGRYDHNIDALYDAYIEAKKKYKEMGDQGHRDKLMECVGRLMTEVYDMLSTMAMDADFRAEKDEVMKRIRQLADM